MDERKLHLYIVDYRKGSGGISEDVRNIYSAYDILDVLTSIENDFDIEFDIDIDDKEKVVDSQLYSYDGEWHDDISKGGDWIYFDLSISIADDSTIEYKNIIRLAGVYNSMSKIEFLNKPIWEAKLIFKDLYQCMTDEQKIKIDRMSDQELMTFWSKNHTDIKDMLGIGIMNDWEGPAGSVSNELDWDVSIKSKE